MSIEDFKFIYWMEYAHRMWGRALGIMFALPFSYLLRKGYITLQLGLRLSGLFALGAGQGLIGWWMVKSGLEVMNNMLAFCLLLTICWYKISNHLPLPRSRPLNTLNQE